MTDVSPYTLTGEASFLILPQEMASSGLAPLSDPSYSLAVLTNTLKSAPFLCKDKRSKKTAYVINCLTVWIDRFYLSSKKSVRIHTMRLALQMWCLIKPPPRMIIPVCLALIAMVLSSLKSCKISSTRPGFLNEWKNIMSPIEPSVNAGLKTGMLFLDAQ